MCKGFIGPIRMVGGGRGGEERRKEDQRHRKDGMKGGGDGARGEGEGIEGEWKVG